MPADRTNETALHRFRIRGKELRYVMELLAGAFPNALRNELSPIVEVIQDRLGEVNDLATAQARLRRKVEADRGLSKKKAWKKLLTEDRR